MPSMPPVRSPVLVHPLISAPPMLVMPGDAAHLLGTGHRAAVGTAAHLVKLAVQATDDAAGCLVGVDSHAVVDAVLDGAAARVTPTMAPA